MALISRFRWLTRTLIALTAAMLFTLTSTALAFASPGGITLLQLSSDPYTNNTSQHQTEVEPDSFSFGSTIVSAFQVGRFYNGGSSNIGWATSTDSGKSWTNGFLPGTTVYATPAGSYARISDPAVAYDAAHHTWIISSLAISSNIAPAVLVSLSTDGGMTWSTPLSVVNAAKTNFDKDWIACDNTSTSKFYGHCYVEWDVSSSSQLIEMSTSTNGGLVWSPPQATASQTDGIGGQPLVQPNGTVIVPISNPPFTQLLSFVSTDGGASWSSTVVAAQTPFYTEEAKIRTGFQSAAMDGSGKVYVVWSGCSFESSCTANDLIMSTTTDGTDWSTPQLIPVDPVGSGVDHIIPALAVDATTSGSSAHLALTYYYFPNASCSTNTCQLNVGYVSSTDGGKTWSAKTQLAGPMMLTWLANTTSGFMVGDYVGASIVHGLAFPIIAVATPPAKQTLNEAIYTVAGGLQV